MTTRRVNSKEVDGRLRPKFEDTEALSKAVVRERTVRSRSDVPTCEQFEGIVR